MRIRPKYLLIATVLLLAACAAGETIPTSVPEADKSRYVADLDFIAQAPRTSIDPHHKAVQDLCADRLSELGYEVERHDFGDGVNVIGTLPGVTHPEEIVIVSAHYDTIPMSNGADDNASGVAAVLETARLLADKDYARTLKIACWDQEEPALYGSYVYAKREKESKADIKVVYVYDEVGVSDDRPDSQRFPAAFEFLYPTEAKKLKANQHRANFVLLIFDQQARPWAFAIADQADKIGLPSITLEVDLNEQIPTDLTGSDHASFWGKEYPAIEINDTSGYRNPFKHTKMDTFDTLDHDFTVKIISAVAVSVRSALESPE